MRARLVLTLAGLLAAGLLPPGRAAQAAPRTQVERGDGSARIALYDSLCDEDNAVECLIAEIGCTAPGDFTATLHNLDSREAGSVFAGAKGREGGKGSVAAGGGTWVLQVTRVALSEHSYNWDVTAASLDRGAEIWRAVWGAAEIELRAGTRRAVLRRADIEASGLRDVVTTCAGPGR